MPPDLQNLRGKQSEHRAKYWAVVYYFPRADHPETHKLRERFIEETIELAMNFAFDRRHQPGAVCLNENGIDIPFEDVGF